MVHMFKLLFLLFFLLILAACGNGQVKPPDTEETPLINAVDYTHEPAIEQYLLPDVPQHDTYIVTLEVDPQTRTVDGISRIVFTNRSGQPMEQVVLRSFLNAFEEGAYPRPYPAHLMRRMEYQGEERGHMTFMYASLNNETLDYSIDGTVITLKFDEPLEPYATINIILQYSAYVPMLGHSIGGNEYAMWFGMFLPVIAVHGHNGWHTDEFYPVTRPFFSETANYRVDITTPARYMVVGTGQRTEEMLEDTRITTFAGDMIRDFAFAVLSPYYNIASVETVSGVEINFYYYSEIASRRANEILHIASISMEHFEYRVGLYAFPQINIVEANLLYNSMPFSQMVFLDMGNYSSHVGLSRSLASQWFSGIVGVNRIYEPWLDTGLSRFVQAGIANDTPELLRNHIELERQTAARRDGISLADGLWAYSNRNHYIDVHGRVASVMLYELMQLMGEEYFWQFINLYYQTFAFQIATVDDFIRLAEEVHGRSLQAFFQDWLEGTPLAFAEVVIPPDTEEDEQ